eukprot:COSAG01_NODE_9515_length_2422_cov_2.959105_2_plen_145_part_00
MGGLNSGGGSSSSSSSSSSRSRWIQARLLAVVIAAVLGLLGEPCDGAPPPSATLAAALGRRCVLLRVDALFALTPSPTHTRALLTGYHPRRHASDTPCSLAAVDLEAHGFDVCSVWNAGQAWPPEADGHGHRLLSVGFGGDTGP